MKMIRKQLYLLYIIICVLSLLSCADNTHEDALHQAEALMEDERYEEAYVLLDSIDGGQFHPGSHQQARYALLYTKSLYKNYIVSSSDSLISLAVDHAEGHGNKKDKFYAYLYQGIVRIELNNYSESSVSFLRALANSDDVDDHYSKGQLFSYLAVVNGEQQCSDEDYYAQKAYKTYQDGALESYANSTMLTKALAKIHLHDLDSARFWIDTCIVVAEASFNHFALRNAKSLKAKYALLLDSIALANQLYNELSEDSTYIWSSQDYENMAYIYAKNNNRQLAYEYLERSRKVTTNNNPISFWGQSVEIARLLSDNNDIIICQDSLIYYQDRMLGNALIHASIASQRDYTEWQLKLSQAHNRQNRLLLLCLVVCLILVLLAFFQYHRKKSLQVQLQSEKIQKYQLQIKQHEKDLADGLQQIKSSEIVSRLQGMTAASGIPHVEWQKLYSIFCEKLPLFEKALRELSPLSETEWRVCMLIKLGFPPSQIAILMNKSAEGISSIRRRLYSKVFNKKGRASDWDEFLNTL